MIKHSPRVARSLAGAGKQLYFYLRVIAHDYKLAILLFNIHFFGGCCFFRIGPCKANRILLFFLPRPFQQHWFATPGAHSFASFLKSCPLLQICSLK